MDRTSIKFIHHIYTTAQLASYLALYGSDELFYHANHNKILQKILMSTMFARQEDKQEDRQEDK